MVLYLNTKFPRTKKNYKREADDNTNRLKSIMEKLVIEERAPEVPSVLKPKPKSVVSGGSTWSYSERKKAPKTFKLV